MTLILTHADCAGHQPGHGHPERPSRLQAALKGCGDLVKIDAPLATPAQLALAHPEGYVTGILDACRESREQRQRFRLDADTVISPGSEAAALRAAGAGIAAVDAVMAGSSKTAFCAVRPPGHHAERQKPMGFCLFNNAAIAAFHAKTVHGADRVAVVDFDVHHGNGTQDIFWNERDLFYASSHQYPFYPGTGSASETGAHANVANSPLAAGAGSSQFRTAWQDHLLPALDRFQPDVLIISAGFDGHADDPLAGLQLGDDDYYWITEQLCALADKHSAGRVISLLEGGYDLQALQAAVAAHLKGLKSA